jgi:hypothetical protein
VRRVPFSCFALPDSFSTVRMALALLFLFYDLIPIFDGTDGVRSRFHVLRSRTRFRRYRWHQVPFSCFALRDSFSTVPGASCPVFMFCAPGLIFGGTECVVSRFHVLRSRTHFRRYRRRQVPFSNFALRYSFSTVPRASSLIFMFCAPGPVFDCTDSVGSRFNVSRSRTCFRRQVPFFQVLRSLTHFRKHRRHQDPFSCFALPDSFSAVPRASCLVFMFYSPGPVFGNTDGLGS